MSLAGKHILATADPRKVALHHCAKQLQITHIALSLAHLVTSIHKSTYEEVWSILSLPDSK